MKKIILMLVVLTSLVLVMGCKKDTWIPSGDFTLREDVNHVYGSWFEENGYSKGADGLYITYNYMLTDTKKAECKGCVNNHIYYHLDNNSGIGNTFRYPCKTIILKKLDEGDFTISTANMGKTVDNYIKVIYLNNPY